MREIKFRGKRKDNGEWVSGCYSFLAYPLSDSISHYIIVNGFSLIEVDPETVGQYTGLKDRNGKEIFEGDILQVPDWYDLPENTSMTYNNQIVTFKNCSFYLKNEPMYENYEYISEECEVIGNIYENPDLLAVNEG